MPAAAPSDGPGRQLDDALAQDLDRLIDEVLLPAAAATDQAATIPRSHLRALADIGLFGLALSAADDGLGLKPPAIRFVMRRLGSGCGATAFAFAQHHGTVGAIAGSSNRSLRRRWLPALGRDRLAGIAFAHVRRPGSPVLSATADGDGWRLNGTAPWVTSWGTAEVLGVAAPVVGGPDGAPDRLLWAVVPASERTGLQVDKRFELMVFQASATVALDFTDYEVKADDVVDVVDMASWIATDRLLASRPNPSCLGVGDRALAMLAERDSDQASRFESWWAEVAERAEAACVTVDEMASAGAESVDGVELAKVAADVAATRAEVVAGVQRLTTALVSSVAGGSMERSQPSQRLAREALFYVVQAQNADGRAAMFDRLTPS